jgi:hypothetical protein
MRSIPGQGNALETEPSFDDAACCPFESFYRANRNEKQPDYQYHCAYLPILRICCTFVAKIHHFVHFFVRKVAFQRERAYIRCAEIVLSIMLERIQYALFVLLFVLAGSLDGATPQGGACRVQPGMSPQAALHAPVTAQNYFTAAVMLSGDASIEIPAHSSEHKAIVRHRFYARSAAAEAVAQQNSALSDRGALYSKPVDYYIFSLGRILI